MSPISSVLARAVAEAGVLANNHELVEQLREALASGSHAQAMVPPLLEEVLEEDAWADRQGRHTNRYTFDPGDPRAFEEFITAPAPRGLGTTPDEVRKYLGPSDNPQRVAFEQVIARGRGAPEGPGANRNPSGVNQFSKHRTNPNKIRVSPDQPEPVDSSILPIGSSARQPFEPVASPPPDPMPRVRDRTREPQAGTSVGYAVRRLGRERPDLLDQVRAGEISANAAMVAAGFRARMIQVPAEPQAAARILRKNLTPEQVAELARLLMTEDVKEA